MPDFYLEGEEKIGRYLPKNLENYHILCKNENLKEQLEDLCNRMQEKQYYDWSFADFRSFKRGISQFSISSFFQIYPMMLPYFSLSKKELEEKLRNFDQKLDLHVFDLKRVIHEERIQVAISGKESFRIQTSYSFEEHQFQLEDFPKLFLCLSSKVKKYGDYTWKYYLSDDFYWEDDMEKKEELTSLLSNFYQNRESLLEPIINHYHEWINCMAKEPFYPYLESLSKMFFTWGCENIQYQLKIYGKLQERDYKQYVAEKCSIRAHQEIISKEKQKNYKFG